MPSAPLSAALIAFCLWAPAAFAQEKAALDAAPAKIAAREPELQGFLKFTAPMVDKRRP